MGLQAQDRLFQRASAGNGDYRGWGIRTRGKTEDGQRGKDGPTPWPLWRCEETQVRWQGERRQWVETARRQKTRVRSWDYTLKAGGSVPASLKQGWIFKILEMICIQLHSSYSNFKNGGPLSLLLVYGGGIHVYTLGVFLHPSPPYLGLV